MTTKQKSAGYFDSLRQTPMYEGDVYYRQGYVEPFYRIMKSEDKGFVVNHVNTREYTPLSDMGSTLVKDGQYIGNILDEPDIIERFKENPDSCVAGFSKIGAAQVDEQKKEKCEQNTEINEQKSEVCEQNEDKNEQSVDDSTDATVKQNSDAKQEDGTGTDDTANTVEDKKEEVSDTKGSNIMIEKAPAAVPEVIANTKEEKNAIERRNFCKKQIEKNNEEIAKIQEKADFHNELASTLKYPPFIKLEKIVIDELHKDVDGREIKDIKEGTKVFENIVAIQNVLKEHSLQAANAENHVSDLEDENEKLQEELEELEEKIGHFAQQTKLNLEAAKETPENEKEETPEAAPADEEKTEEAACEIVVEVSDTPEEKAEQ